MWQRFFGSEKREIVKSQPISAGMKPPPALEDADYQLLFTQLLEGVKRGWDRERVLKVF